MEYRRSEVTGVLMFESEHSLGGHLKRRNNWEIHPLFAMDYCPKKKKCTAESDDNWGETRRSAVERKNVLWKERHPRSFRSPLPFINGLEGVSVRTTWTPEVLYVE